MQNVRDTAHAISEKVKEITSGVSNEVNKGTSNNATTNKIEEKSPEAKKESSEERGVIGQIGDTISHAYHYVAEKVHEATSSASSEGNKGKNSDSTAGQHLATGASAAGSKGDEENVSSQN